MNNKNKILYSLSIAAIIGGLGIIVYIFYLLLWPVKVLEIRGDVKILNPNVKVGEEVVYEVDFCKYKDIPGVLSRQLVDTAVVSMPDMGITLRKGCGKIQASLPTPKFLTTGTYNINFVARYKINAIRTITVTYKSEDFKMYK